MAKKGGRGDNGKNRGDKIKWQKGDNGKNGVTMTKWA